MNKYFKFALITLAIFGIHYLFIAVIRSQIYPYVVLGLYFLSAIISFVGSIEYFYTKKSTTIPNTIFSICIIYILLTTIMFLSNIGGTKSTRLYTLQMTYSDGFTETATYKLPSDADIYLQSGGRYNNTDLAYRSYPFGGGTIQLNIIRYKIISIK